jgi:hypothetical protein
MQQSCAVAVVVLFLAVSLTDRVQPDAQDIRRSADIPTGLLSINSLAFLLHTSQKTPCQPYKNLREVSPPPHTHTHTFTHILKTI